MSMPPSGSSDPKENVQGAEDNPQETVRRWRRRPAGSTWGDFGPDDQLGRLNLITAAEVRRAAAEVREGLTFCLSLPLDYPGGSGLSPSRKPPLLRSTLRNNRPRYNYLVCEEIPDATDVESDDLTILYLQYSTQWDGLSHIGSLFDADGDGVLEPVYYNGFRAGRDIQGPADPASAGTPLILDTRLDVHAGALGVEGMAVHGIQGRGVMVDLHAHLGRERVAVGYDRLMRILEVDKVQVEGGDMLCLHTGLAAMILKMARVPDIALLRRSCAVLDGRDRRLLRWITDSQISCLVADNHAVEEPHPVPELANCCANLPLHEHCLFKLGLNLGELWHLTPLANWLRTNGRFRFQLTAPPLRLPGAVGSPVTPIATV